MKLTPALAFDQAGNTAEAYNQFVQADPIDAAQWTSDVLKMSGAFGQALLDLDAAIKNADSAAVGTMLRDNAHWVGALTGTTPAPALSALGLQLDPAKAISRPISGRIV